MSIVHTFLTGQTWTGATMSDSIDFKKYRLLHGHWTTAATHSCMPLRRNEIARKAKKTHKHQTELCAMFSHCIRRQISLWWFNSPGQVCKITNIMHIITDNKSRCYLKSHFPWDCFARFLFLFHLFCSLARSFLHLSTICRSPAHPFVFAVKVLSMTKCYNSILNAEYWMLIQRN